MQALAAGAFHTVVAGWKPVTHLATLRMLQRAGWIMVPPEYGQRGRSALGPVTHRYVKEGERAPGSGMFEVRVRGRTRTFRLQWADGCFHPFLWELRP